jgi:hypothetical protein
MLQRVARRCERRDASSQESAGNDAMFDAQPPEPGAGLLRFAYNDGD